MHKSYVSELRTSLKDEDYCAYVDGSYNEQTKTYSCGIVIYNNCEKKVFAFSEKRSKFMKYKNVIAELEAALFAMNYVSSKKGKRLVICYDYLGIEDYCKSNSKKELVTYYKNEYKDIINKGLNIEFKKTDKSDSKHLESHNACRSVC